MGLFLPILLKLAAASLSGTILFIIGRKIVHNNILSIQASEIRNSLRNVAEPLPTILVIGFRGHGKSAFVNTACRVLKEEDGPLILRSETAPVTITKGSTTRETSLVHVSGSLTLVDTPGLPIERLSRDNVEEALRQIRANYPAPECVVVVLRCTDVPSERGVVMMKLPELVSVIRDGGLPYVVVLTHRKPLRNKKKVEDLRKEVSMRARTDCIYFIENYTTDAARSDNRLITIKNNFHTHNVALAVIRQCIEFTTIYRNALLRKTHGEQPTSKKLSDPQ